MGSYPQDFPVPLDQGGPGAGRLLGGFGGTPSGDRAGHRTAVQKAGKAPVVLRHGNQGVADSGKWDVLDLKRFLTGAGYPGELIWAPSYLGDGDFDDPFPHTNNINEVREFVDRVCDYLAVEVIDIIAHSLGCSLAYAVFRGLEKRTSPVSWGEQKRWHRVGTFVALAGAFHGLGPHAKGEWVHGGEFMKELLEETDGGGGETPFGNGKPQTQPPRPHNITYFCGVAKDFIDGQRPGTGKLAGAINKDYQFMLDLFTAHEEIKENRDVLPISCLI
jgi:hypothetical protein